MFPAIDPALVTTEPALETTEPATLLAAEAEFVAVSTKEVTAAFLRYQITSRRIALGRLALFLTSEVSGISGSFGGNGVDDSLEKIACSSGGED